MRPLIVLLSVMALFVVVRPCLSQRPQARPVLATSSIQIPVQRLRVPGRVGLSSLAVTEVPPHLHNQRRFEAWRLVSA